MRRRDLLCGKRGAPMTRCTTLNAEPRTAPTMHANRSTIRPMRRSWMLIAMLLGGCADDSFGPPPIAGGDGGSDESSSDDASEPLPDEQPLRLVDQSGAVFFWDCETDDDGDCHVRRIEGVSPPLATCSNPRPYGYFAFRFFEIVASCGDESGTSWDDDAARYAVCESSADCPQRDDAKFECRAGFCQNVDTELYPAGLPDLWEIDLLCIGDNPRFSTDYEEMVDIWNRADEACPSVVRHEPCNYLPAGCADPRV